MTHALDQKLDALKAAAETQTETYKNSRQQLYEGIVDAYLWWREAHEDPEYLATKYKDAGITVRKPQSNQPNFFALLRLVWNVDASTRASAISNWAKSMQRIDEQYSDNLQAYQNDPRAHLLNFIHTSGGLGGLRGEKELYADEVDTNEDSETAPAPAKKTPVAQALSTQRIEAASNSQPLATLNNFPNAVTNDNGLIVMLGRRTEHGTIDIVGTDYSEAALALALDYCTNIDRTSVAPNLRLIAEALEPHALPKKLEKHRKRYFAESTIVRKKQGQKPEKIKVNTTLRTRPEHSDILVSKSPTTVSVVSQIKPKQDFDFATEATLFGKDRQWIEAELLGKNKLTLYTAEPSAGYTPDTSTRVADYNITLTDTASSKNRRLHFYDVTKLSDQSAIQQPFVSNPSQIEYDWTMQVSKQWLATFDAVCLTAWINKIAGKHNKPENRTVMVMLTEDELVLHAWWDEKAQQYQLSYSVALAGITPSFKQDASASFQCAAKDFVLLFSSLPNIVLDTDKITIQANSHVMNINYSTSIADYQHFIPAADTNGKRDETVFSNTLKTQEASE